MPHKGFLFFIAYNEENTFCSVTMVQLLKECLNTTAAHKVLNFAQGLILIVVKKHFK